MFVKVKDKKKWLTLEIVRFRMRSKQRSQLEFHVRPEILVDQNLHFIL